MFETALPALIGLTTSSLKVNLRAGRKYITTLLFCFGEIRICPAKPVESLPRSKVTPISAGIVVVPDFVLKEIERKGAFVSGDCKEEAREWLENTLPEILRIVCSPEQTV